MPPDTTQYLQSFYDTARALGNKAHASNATLVIRGYEHLQLLTKSFPWPINSVGEPLEIYIPGGAKVAQPGQTQIKFEGAISFYETVKGHMQEFSHSIIGRGGLFQATVYAGTPQAFTRALELKDCFIVFDQGESDWESDGQPATRSGTLHYHFFGETLPGNLKS